MESFLNRRLGWVVIGIMAGVLVVSTLVLLVAGVGISKSNGQVLDIVLSCTTPGEECYERGQRQGADAVDSINQVAVFAAACADNPEQQTVEQIQSCVMDAIAAEAKKRRR